jgi:hypothetical protein
LQDDESMMNASDEIRSLRRAAFQELHVRREITLYERVKLGSRQRWTAVGRKKARGIYDTELSRKATKSQANRGQSKQKKAAG